MADLLHDPKLAEEMIAHINAAAKKFILKSNCSSAGNNVPVDEVCNNTYQEGMRLTEKYESQLMDAAELIQVVSQILEQANQEAANKNAASESRNIAGDFNGR